MMTEKLHKLDIRHDFPAPEFPVEPIDFDTLKNGLAVRMPNWLGDAVMALPALYQLREMLPKEFALTVIAPAGMRPFFMSLPWLDMFFALENTHKNWTPVERKVFRSLHMGAAVLFNNSLRDTIMLRMCGVRRLYGAAARCRGILMERSFKFPPRLDRELNKLHHANKYLSIARALGAPEWDGKLPEIEIAIPYGQMPFNLRALCEHPDMLVLACGAAYGAAKRWSSENYREVARRWIEERDGIVVSVGSKSEKPIGDEISSGLPPERFFNTMGGTDMCQLMHLLKSSRHVLANDSGVMHLAAALDCKGTAVFGSTDYTATGPIAPDWNIFYSGEKCSPCFCRTCPNDNPMCMKNITADDVWEVLGKL